jgi:hypothetical protein
VAQEKSAQGMKLNTPDVPVFTAAYQRSQTQVSRALRADPGSGQTPGFAHRAVLREDPSLVRCFQTSDLLIEHLRHRDEKNVISAVYHQAYFINHITESDGVVIAPQDWRPLLKKSSPIKINFYLRESAALIYSCLAILGRKIACSIVLPSIKFQIPNYKLQINIKVPRLNLDKSLLGHVGQAMVVSSIVLFLLTMAPILRLQAGEWWEQSRVAVTGKAAEPHFLLNKN